MIQSVLRGVLHLSIRLRIDRRYAGGEEIGGFVTLCDCRGLRKHVATAGRASANHDIHGEQATKISNSLRTLSQSDLLLGEC